MADSSTGSSRKRRASSDASDTQPLAPSVQPAQSAPTATATNNDDRRENKRLAPVRRNRGNAYSQFDDGMPPFIKDITLRHFSHIFKHLNDHVLRIFWLDWYRLDQNSMELITKYTDKHLAIEARSVNGTWKQLAREKIFNFRKWNQNISTVSCDDGQIPFGALEWAFYLEELSAANDLGLRPKGSVHDNIMYHCKRIQGPKVTKYPRIIADDESWELNMPIEKRTRDHYVQDMQTALATLDTRHSYETGMYRYYRLSRPALQQFAKAIEEEVMRDSHTRGTEHEKGYVNQMRQTVNSICDRNWSNVAIYHGTLKKYLGDRVTDSWAQNIIGTRVKVVSRPYPAKSGSLSSINKQKTHANVSLDTGNSVSVYTDLVILDDTKQTVAQFLQGADAKKVNRPSRDTENLLEELLKDHPSKTQPGSVSNTASPVRNAGSSVDTPRSVGSTPSPNEGPTVPSAGPITESGDADMGETEVTQYQKNASLRKINVLLFTRNNGQLKGVQCLRIGDQLLDRLCKEYQGKASSGTYTAYVEQELKKLKTKFGETGSFLTWCKDEFGEEKEVVVPVSVPSVQTSAPLSNSGPTVPSVGISTELTDTTMGGTEPNSVESSTTTKLPVVSETVTVQSEEPTDAMADVKFEGQDRAAAQSAGTVAPQPSTTTKLSEVSETVTVQSEELTDTMDDVTFEGQDQAAAQPAGTVPPNVPSNEETDGTDSDDWDLYEDPRHPRSATTTAPPNAEDPDDDMRSLFGDSDTEMDIDNDDSQTHDQGIAQQAGGATSDVAASSPQVEDTATAEVSGIAPAVSQPAAEKDDKAESASVKSAEKEPNEAEVADSVDAAPQAQAPKTDVPSQPVVSTSSFNADDFKNKDWSGGFGLMPPETAKKDGKVEVAPVVDAASQKQASGIKTSSATDRRKLFDHKVEAPSKTVGSNFDASKWSAILDQDTAQGLNHFVVPVQEEESETEKMTNRPKKKVATQEQVSANDPPQTPDAANGTNPPVNNSEEGTVVDPSDDSQNLEVHAPVGSDQDDKGASDEKVPGGDQAVTVTVSQPEVTSESTEVSTQDDAQTVANAVPQQAKLAAFNVFRSSPQADIDDIGTGSDVSRFDNISDVDPEHVAQQTGPNVEELIKGLQKLSIQETAASVDPEHVAQQTEPDVEELIERFQERSIRATADSVEVATQESAPVTEEDSSPAQGNTAADLLPQVPQPPPQATAHVTPPPARSRRIRREREPTRRDDEPWSPEFENIARNNALAAIARSRQIARDDAAIALSREIAINNEAIARSGQNARGDSTVARRRRNARGNSTMARPRQTARGNSTAIPSSSTVRPLSLLDLEEEFQTVFFQAAQEEQTAATAQNSGSQEEVRAADSTAHNTTAQESRSQEGGPAADSTARDTDTERATTSAPPDVPPPQPEGAAVLPGIEPNLKWYQVLILIIGLLVTAMGAWAADGLKKLRPCALAIWRQLSPLLYIAKVNVLWLVGAFFRALR